MENVNAIDSKFTTNHDRFNAAKPILFTYKGVNLIVILSKINSNRSVDGAMYLIRVRKLMFNSCVEPDIVE